MSSSNGWKQQLQILNFPTGPAEQEAPAIIATQDIKHEKAPDVGRAGNQANDIPAQTLFSFAAVQHNHLGSIRK